VTIERKGANLEAAMAGDDHFLRDQVIGMRPRNEEPTVRTLLLAIREKLRELYGHEALKPQLPPGLRLEMHPDLFNRVLTDADLTYRSGNFIEPVQEYFGLPVKVVPELPRLGFRLVVITEELLLGGSL